LWFVPYQPGTVEAIARSDDDTVVARHELRTSGPCAKITLRADRSEIKADGQDVAHVEVRLEDENGLLVPDDGRQVEFELSGPGKIIAVDNGDLADPAPYPSRSRTTREGRCLALIQSTRRPGALGLHASSPGLGGASVEIPANSSGKSPVQLGD